MSLSFRNGNSARRKTSTWSQNSANCIRNPGGAGGNKHTNKKKPKRNRKLACKRRASGVQAGGRRSGVHFISTSDCGGGGGGGGRQRALRRGEGRGLQRILFSLGSHSLINRQSLRLPGNFRRLPPRAEQPFFSPSIGFALHDSLRNGPTCLRVRVCVRPFHAL